MSCGFCCRGLLHSHGVLKGEEVNKASAQGLEVLQVDPPAFALPCPKFDGCCTIYDGRPKACRGFRCPLLRRLDDNDIGLDEALEIVAEARRLASEAMPNASAAELASEFRAQRRVRQLDSAEDRNDGKRVKFIALGLYLDKHFVLPRDGNFYSIQPIAGGSS